LRRREVLPFVFSLLLTAPALGQSRRPPPGTYEFVLCNRACRDSTTRVGAGVFVVVDGDIRKALSGVPLDSIENVAWGSVPNACFRVSADSVIGGREYYPSIIPVGLTAATEADDDAFSLRLYASPDASDSALCGQGTGYWARKTERLERTRACRILGHDRSTHGSARSPCVFPSKLSGPPNKRLKLAARVD